MADTFAFVSAALNIHLNIGQNTTINTSSVFVTMETASPNALASRVLEPMAGAQIRLPSTLQVNTTDNASSVSLRVSRLFCSSCSLRIQPTYSHSCNHWRHQATLARTPTPMCPPRWPCPFSTRTAMRSPFTPPPINPSL